MKIAASHFADKRALIGAELNKADNQRAVLENRKTTLTEAVGQLKDADMAKVVTDLQTLLLNKEASQKAFAMVSRLSLFDYITQIWQTVEIRFGLNLVLQKITR